MALSKSEAEKFISQTEKSLYYINLDYGLVCDPLKKLISIYFINLYIPNGGATIIKKINKKLEKYTGSSKGENNHTNYYFSLA